MDSPSAGVANMELAQLEDAETVEEALTIAQNSGIPAQNFIVADRGRQDCLDHRRTHSFCESAAMMPCCPRTGVCPKPDGSAGSRQISIHSLLTRPPSAYGLPTLAPLMAPCSSDWATAATTWVHARSKSAMVSNSANIFLRRTCAGNPAR